MKTQLVPPEWAWEFHGHQCPFMPIGYRMGKLAMQQLGVEHEADHGFFIFPELGEGHPQTCMMDGMQVATGATYGKLLMAKTFYGKLAATFYHAKKGAVRFSLNRSSLTPWASSSSSPTARKESNLPRFLCRYGRK